jgi:hypothetical protein
LVSSGVFPGVNGWVSATTTWDPDGAGPRPPALVIGGGFTLAGGVTTTNIALFDPVANTWSALGDGLGIHLGAPGPAGTHVMALAVLPNGDLVAGGRFGNAGSQSATNIARWNGTNWSQFGNGIGTYTHGAVTALALLPNGSLVAGAETIPASGVPVNTVQQWNGSGWSALGLPFGSRVQDLFVRANGELIAAGNGFVSRWTGSTWSNFGAPLAPFHAYALTALPGGDLVAAGSGGVIARWNGVSWSSLATSVTGYGVLDLDVLPNGDLVAGGWFTQVDGVLCNNIARWNGSVWSPLGGGVDSSIACLGLYAGAVLVAGGDFTGAGGRSARGIAAWDGLAWTPLASGVDDDVSAVVALPNGGFVIGGDFSGVAGSAATRVASFDGAAWSGMGAGFNARVHALARLPNGEVVAGGEFTASGATPLPNIARWNGTAWLPLGAGIGGWVRALAVMPNGDLIASGGDFSAPSIARWSGTSWSSLGTPGFLTYALLPRANGDLIAGGLGAGAVARWNGTAWSTLGAGLGSGPVFGLPHVTALAELPNGDLIAGGSFFNQGSTSFGGVARWNGAVWSPLGGGVSISPYERIGALCVLPDGDVVVGGKFATASGMAIPNLARWNGSAWTAFGGGTDNSVACLARTSRDDLMVGGSFTNVGGTLSPHLARFVATCPPAVVSSGAGCPGSGGPNLLTATSLPWTGSAFRSLATGLPSPGLAIALLGLLPAAVPLPSLLPIGQAGCDLLVSPLILDLRVPNAGSLALAVPLADSPTFAGYTFYQQVIALEIDSLGNLSAMTSTNALQVIEGTF